MHSVYSWNILNYYRRDYYQRLQLVSGRVHRQRFGIQSGAFDFANSDLANSLTCLNFA